MVSALTMGMTGSASAQSVCPPGRDGLTITLVGEDYQVPGHGRGCISVPRVPDVYVDENGTIVIDRGSGSTRLCVVGIEGSCILATET
jgi:hypothetical protein